MVKTCLSQSFAFTTTILFTTTAVLLATAPAVKARTDNRQKIVVLVHGLENDPRNGFGVDCEWYWGNMIEYLRDKGWSNTINPITYYENDTACNQNGTFLDGQPNVLTSNISVHGPNNWYFNQDGERGTGHTANASIRHLAQHFAWFLYDTYGEDGRTVDVVAHSMGGLIVRYAINAVEKGFRDFPPRILVEDVVTLGTPHAGAPISALCQGVQNYVQCEEITGAGEFSLSLLGGGIAIEGEDSELIRYLKTEALNPQGEGGTQWTLQGSNDDRLVPSGSAVLMNAEYRVKYIDENISHSDFLTNNQEATNASAQVWNGSQFVNQPSYYWPLRLIDLALTYKAW